ncbi:MAG TPA: hypothetical protein VFJ06_03875 [Halococcus sp.]|nr:hypothetical protein [Halococcus sp.]
MAVDTPTPDDPPKSSETAQTDETAASTADESTDEALPDTVSLAVPESANRSEAAAIAAAVGAHLRDRAVAGVTTDTPDYCNRWKLCGRLGGRNPPQNVVHGEEWKAAGRARW